MKNCNDYLRLFHQIKYMEKKIKTIINYTTSGHQTGLKASQINFFCHFCRFELKTSVIVVLWEQRPRGQSFKKNFMTAAVNLIVTTKKRKIFYVSKGENMQVASVLNSSGPWPGSHGKTLEQTIWDDCVLLQAAPASSWATLRHMRLCSVSYLGN